MQGLTASYKRRASSLLQDQHSDVKGDMSVQLQPLALLQAPRKAVHHVFLFLVVDLEGCMQPSGWTA